jgi:hypothetical protein
MSADGVPARASLGGPGRWGKPQKEQLKNEIHQRTGISGESK